MTRETLVVSFTTSTGRTRTVSIPGPRPLAEFQESMLDTLEDSFVKGQVFDAGAPAGAAVGMARCVHQKTETDDLF